MHESEPLAATHRAGAAARAFDRPLPMARGALPLRLSRLRFPPFLSLLDLGSSLFGSSHWQRVDESLRHEADESRLKGESAIARKLGTLNFREQAYAAHGHLSTAQTCE